MVDQVDMFVFLTADVPVISRSVECGVGDTATCFQKYNKHRQSHNKINMDGREQLRQQCRPV